MRIYEECPACGEVVTLIIEAGIRGDPDRVYVEDQDCVCEIEWEWPGELLGEVDLEDLWAEEMGRI